METTQDGLAELDPFRVAVGLAKDVQGVLPAGEKKDAIGASLADTERRMRLAEAQIARGTDGAGSRRQAVQCRFPPI
jgi:hypothetical protein